MAEGTFAAAINCMDGRVQEPVIHWIKTHYNVDYVDSITEAGPNKVLLEANSEQLDTVKAKIEVSLNAHGSELIALIGHADCAGNPISKDKKVDQTKQNMQTLQNLYPNATVIGLYVNDAWEVERID
ncbi:carbonic anhydrase [Tuberibacillus sp. Marseille-P3662]|uniref:carbonic anhydrase n=1 Tax=Tuberibacillus sp. Marseille-P3662 TaxID=1965358 RepID=UPI000A1CE726|nr:carbonic anhydrase [Tuberibacillus sp. Marseille-P3662]